MAVRKLFVAAVVAACAAAVVLCGHWVLQNLMFWLPMHMHVFGVVVFGFGYLALAVLCCLAAGIILEIFLGNP